MRTTVTLDPDVVQGLRELQEAKSLTPKAAINEALRLGLRGLRDVTVKERTPFVQKTYDMGEFRFDPSKANGLLAELDFEEWAEKHEKAGEEYRKVPR